MAIFRPGALAATISGQVGGASFALSKTSPSIRQPRRRTTSRTAASQTRKSTFKAFLTLWRRLSDDSRAAWRAAAAEFPHVNRVGVVSRLSGYNLFMKFATSATLGPGQFNLIPPAMTTLPAHIITAASYSVSGAATVSLAKILPSSYTSASLFGSRPFTTNPVTFFRYTDLSKTVFSTDVPTSFKLNFEFFLGIVAAGETISIQALPKGNGHIPGMPVSITLTVLP